MSSLEEEAKKRRERLALLKQKRASLATGENVDPQTGAFCVHEGGF